MIIYIKNFRRCAHKRFQQDFQMHYKYTKINNASLYQQRPIRDKNCKRKDLFYYNSKNTTMPRSKSNKKCVQSSWGKLQSIAKKHEIKLRKCRKIKHIHV